MVLCNEPLLFEQSDIANSSGPPTRKSSQAKHERATRIIIAIEQPLFRDGLRSFLQKHADLKVVGDSGAGDLVIRLTQQLRPEVLVLDISTARLDGMSVLSQLSASKVGTSVIILCDELSKAQMIKAIRFGVRGIVFKDSESSVLLEAIRKVSAGQYWIQHENLIALIHAASDENGGHLTTQNEYGLTSREHEVIAAVLDGYSNPDIAEKLGLSEQTVKHHLSHIFDKLGVYSRLELALFAVNHRLVEG